MVGTIFYSTYNIRRNIWRKPFKGNLSYLTYGYGCVNLAERRPLKIRGKARCK